MTQELKRWAFLALIGSFVAASFSNSFFEIFTGAFLCLSLLALVLEKRFDVFKSLFGLVVCIYFLVAVLSLTQSSYWATSLKGVFRVLRCALMSFFVIYLVEDERRFKKIFYVFAVSAFLIGLDALLQGVSGIEFLRGRPMTPFSAEVGRVTGPFQHANDFSAYLSLVIFIFLGMIYFLKKNGLWKGLFFDAFGGFTLVICLLWTYSRGAWLAVLLGCIVMAFLKRSRMTVISLIVFCLLIYFLSPVLLKSRMASLWNPKDGTMTERRLLWNEAIQMNSERPWLGYGINTYAKIEPQFKSKQIHTDNQYAHNGYLQIAAETGWVGLGSFLAVIIFFFARAFKKESTPQNEFLSAAAFSLTLGILSFLIHSATDTDLQSLRLVSLLWLSMGLVLAAKKISGNVAG